MFFACNHLVKVVLCEGLEQIPKDTFMCCNSLKVISIPSSVKEIGIEAFSGCFQVMEVGLSEGIQKIDTSAFQYCFSLRNVALPSTLASQCFGPACLDLMRVFGSQRMIFDTLKKRFDGLPIHKLCYYQSYCPTKATINKLQDLFDHANLVIDEFKSILGDKSDSAEASLNKQDCLGMTPLHILTCATKQNLDLYQFIVAKFPKNLTIEDKWGCLPLLYAIWSNTPQEIIQFMIDSQKTSFPNHVLDWDKMVETLCRAGACLETVQRLLQIHHESFPEQDIDWQKAARELIISNLVRYDYFGGWSEDFFLEDWSDMVEALRASVVHQELISNLQELHQNFFPDYQSEMSDDSSDHESNNMEKLDLVDETKDGDSFESLDKSEDDHKNGVNWQLLCEGLVQPLKDWWRSDESMYHPMNSFRFLIKCSIAERLNTIGVRRWRMDISQLVERVPFIDCTDLGAHFDTLHSKLVAYEREYYQLKDLAFLLELALWKSKIDELDDNAALIVEPT